MSIVIEVENLKREYITVKGWVKRKKEIIKAVDGIDFSVEEGEIFGLLGQNGAGKTTTIKMLITLLAPTSGKCKVLGYDTFGEEKKIREHINFIFGGEMGVYRRLSAKDNLKYFANLYHIEPEVANARIKEVLELVGLTEKQDILVETYSKGMIQRIQIARGLINNPKIIFMDEPTVGLDPLGARMLRNVIKDLKAKGITILLTTHNMNEADDLCDRIAIINKGKMVALDTPQNLKKKVHEIRTMELTLKNVTVTQLEAIKGLKGVKDVETQENDSKCTLNIRYNINCDISGEVLSIFKNETIYSFAKKDISLEDVYVELVGNTK